MSSTPQTLAKRPSKRAVDVPATSRLLGRGERHARGPPERAVEQLQDPQRQLAAGPSTAFVSTDTAIPSSTAAACR